MSEAVIDDNLAFSPGEYVPKIDVVGELRAYPNRLTKRLCYRLLRSYWDRL
jgi:hypothetical protein